RTNAYFGFSESDISAYQPIHRLGSLHVGLGFADGFHLVRRFFVNERSFEFTLPRGVRRKRMARLRIPGRLNGKLLAGAGPHRALCLRFGLRPSRAPERVQRRSCLASADIFADEMGLSDRNVEFGWWLARIIRRVFDYETLLSGRRLCFSDFRRF